LIRDLTAERQAAAALAEASARTRAIVDAAVDGIVSIDERGVIESFNPAAERLFGYPADEAIGQNVTLLMPPPHCDAHNDYVARYLRTGEKKIIGIGREVIGQRKDGSPFPMELAVSEVRQSGRALFIGIARDISARKQAEKTVQELQRHAQQRERLADIGAITAQIVHEVGNPLAGISTQAQLILRRAERDASLPLSSAVDALGRILAEVYRLDGLIKEFMEFSREQRLNLKPVALDRLLREVFDLWQPVAARHEVALGLQLPQDIPPLTADAEKLRRVLDNLVKNAIEAIDRGPGQVVAQVTLPSPEAVHIAVSDTGPGISDAVQVFRLFETTKAQGSGIGLAVARQIVLAHRGTIDYARLEPRGTAFHITLPRGGPMG